MLFKLKLFQPQKLIYSGNPLHILFHHIKKKKNNWIKLDEVGMAVSKNTWISVGKTYHTHYTSLCLLFSIVNIYFKYCYDPLVYVIHFPFLHVPHTNLVSCPDLTPRHPHPPHKSRLVCGTRIRVCAYAVQHQRRCYAVHVHKSVVFRLPALSDRGGINSPCVHSGTYSPWACGDQVHSWLHFMRNFLPLGYQCSSIRR